MTKKDVKEGIKCCPRNSPTYKIDNPIDNRLFHGIIACSGLALPFDNFQINELADFLFY